MDYGYAGRILRLDLTTGKTGEMLTRESSGRFLGGRGIAQKVYWDEVPPDSGADDEKNRLIFSTGPLAGLPALGGSRWQISAKSPMPTPEQYCYGNLGGTWGAALKLAGYDALVVHGKADRPVYLFIDDERVELRDADPLWGRGAIETREALKAELGSSLRVATIGPAGENAVPAATVVADNDSSGAGGVAAVMGSKKLKAVVVGGSRRAVSVAHPERLKELTDYYRDLRRLALPGVSPLRFSRELVPSFGARMKREPCFGCLGCFRGWYEMEDGQAVQLKCHAGVFYQAWSLKHYGSWNEVPIQATRLCYEYGLDSKAIDLLMCWLEACYHAGVLSEEMTDIPLSKAGSLEYIQALTGKIARREGFGDLLAAGVDRAARMLGADAGKLAEQVGYFALPEYRDLYGPRLYPVNAMLYAMDSRLPYPQIHELGVMMPKWVAWVKGVVGANASTESLKAIARRAWGGEQAVDFSTMEGNALAAKKIQDREYVKECLVLCDLRWPLVDLENSEDHAGDTGLESRILSAVTGEEIDEEGLYRVGERVLNLHRAILAREGHAGRDFDVLPDRCHDEPLEFDFVNKDLVVPGSEGEVLSRRGAVLARADFERVKDEYYRLRRWDVATGLQLSSTLGNMGLRDVASDLEARGLAVRDSSAH